MHKSNYSTQTNRVSNLERPRHHTNTMGRERLSLTRGLQGQIVSETGCTVFWYKRVLVLQQWDIARGVCVLTHNSCWCSVLLKENNRLNPCRCSHCPPFCSGVQEGSGLCRWRDGGGQDIVDSGGEGFLPAQVLRLGRAPWHHQSGERVWRELVK